MYVRSSSFSRRSAFMRLYSQYAPARSPPQMVTSIAISSNAIMGGSIGAPVRRFKKRVERRMGEKIEPRRGFRMAEGARGG